MGTHRDRVPGPRAHEAISGRLWDAFGGSPAWRRLVPLPDGARSDGPGRLLFFPVDCTGGGDGGGVARLRAAVAECAAAEEFARRPVSCPP